MDVFRRVLLMEPFLRTRLRVGVCFAMHQVSLLHVMKLVDLGSDPSAASKQVGP